MYSVIIFEKYYFRRWAAVVVYKTTKYECCDYSIVIIVQVLH